MTKSKYWIKFVVFLILVFIFSAGIDFLFHIITQFDLTGATDAIRITDNFSVEPAWYFPSVTGLLGLIFGIPVYFIAEFLRKNKLSMWEWLSCSVIALIAGLVKSKSYGKIASLVSQTRAENWCWQTKLFSPSEKICLLDNAGHVILIFWMLHAWVYYISFRLAGNIIYFIGE